MMFIKTLSSLDDHMMERRLEVRETKSDFSELLLIASATTDDANKIWAADVVAGVLSAEASVLVFTHVRHVVGILIHPLPVEHVASESTFALVLSPVRRGILEINA